MAKSDAERKRLLLNALPEDGSAVGNTNLMRRLKWSADTYFKLRDDLVTEAKVQTGRGRGGSVRLATPHESGAQPKRTKKGSPERALYPRFLESLKTWASGQGWTDHVVQQTSDQGRRRTGGRFTRPDFVVVGMKKYEYTPGIVRDLETFEVKPIGATIEAVFETAAHSRIGTKSYLALHTAADNPTEDDLGRIEAECQRFGVGLVTFEDPGRFDAWLYLVEPVRSEPDPELVEQFITSQISAKNQERIRKLLH
jgi:hypothetical protein